MPAEWNGFVVYYRYHQTVYHLHVSKQAGKQESSLSPGSAAMEKSNRTRSSYSATTARSTGSTLTCAGLDSP